MTLTTGLDLTLASDEWLNILYEGATRRQFGEGARSREEDANLTGMRYRLEQEMASRGTYSSRSAMILSAVPAKDRALVGLHSNLLRNTGGGRPSDSARAAVRESLPARP